MRGQIATCGLRESAAPDGPRSPERQRAPSKAPRAPLATIDQALAEIAAGRMVVVVDDADRENEGDLVMAAEAVSADAINFMVTHGRGLVCLPMAGQRLDALRIGPMVPDNAGREETAFTVSIDLDLPRSTGISAADRAATIRRAVDPTARPRDFRRPGHVFPLRARDGGVLEREGHTEAAVDLARLAGLAPAGVICEIMSGDGTMARLPQLLAFARRQGLLVISIADLIAYRRVRESDVVRVATTRLPTAHGTFALHGYRASDGTEHLALVQGDPGRGAPLVRIHSECLTGDAFGSHRCDCGQQLDAALAAVAAAGCGVVVYLRGHEGRGIGLVEKLRAYALQDQGIDTVEANLRLGHAPDSREYHVAAQILADLGVSRLRLLTNNPDKQRAIESAGLVVHDRIGLQAAPNPHNLRYLAAKSQKMGHDLPCVTDRVETA